MVGLKQMKKSVWVFRVITQRLGYPVGQVILMIFLNKIKIKLTVSRLSVRTALLALIGFMPTFGEGALGSVDYTPEERKILAKKYYFLENIFMKCLIFLQKIKIC